MADELNFNAAMGAVNLLVSAVKSYRLYPASSDIVKNSLRTGYMRLTTLFYRDAPFVVSEAQGAILFDGKPLDARSQRIPQIRSLQSLMEGLNLKSLVFDPGIDQASYAKLTRILSMAPEELQVLGGVRQLLETEGVAHVSVNHKVFVAADSTEVIASDEDLFGQIWYGQVAELQALGHLTKKIADLAWLKTVSRRFLLYIADKGHEPNDWETITRLAKLSGLLIKAGAETGSDLALPVLYESLEALGPWFNADALALNLSDRVVARAVDQLDDDSFVLLSARLLLMHRSQRRGSRLVSRAKLEPYAAASDWMLGLPRGIELKYPVDEARKQEERHQKKELSRIDGLIDALMGGDSETLNDLEALAALPRMMTERVQMGRGDEAEKMIQAIALAINLDDARKSMSAVRVLLHTGRSFLSLARRDMVIRVVGPINLWVRYQQEVTPLLESVADMMVHHVHNLVVSGHVAEAIPVAETFSLIVQGRLKKGPKMTRYAEKTLSRMASERVFNILMEAFRTNANGCRGHASTFLVQLGRISVPPLLDLLRDSDEMAERIRTMGVLQNIGPAARGVLTERITPDNTWYYLRNLLKLLGGMGGEDDVEMLEPLILREEEQVLDAVISCVDQIGGDKRGRFFSKAILQVPNTIKPRLAGLLSHVGGDEAVYALSSVLTSRLVGSPDEKNHVIQSVCEAMGEIGSMKALPSLQRMVNQKGLLGRSRFTAEQKTLAEGAILKIRDAISKERSTVRDTPPETRKKVTREFIGSEDFSTLEAIVNGLISGDKKSSALKMLFLMVVRAAREKDFQRADRYKARIAEVDELALGELVRAEEIIEQEKHFVDAGEYMETWKDFYALLTEAEASSFYHHVKNQAVAVDEEILSQGSVINRLYFINSGRVKIIYKDGPKEIFISEMGKGDVAGYDAFFRTSVSTASLVALSSAHLGYLDRESLKAVADHHPDFTRKLRRFCGRFNNLSETVQAKGLERRRYKRFDVSATVVLQLMTDKGTPVGKSFSGAILDISEGGLSAEVKSRGHDMARLLLGRSIGSLMKSGEESAPFSVQGRVSSVNARSENTLSIHIAFVRPLDVSVLETFVASS